MSFADDDIYVVDTASANTTNLTEHQGQVLNRASSLSRDGKTLLITSNEKGGYQNVALLDIAAKKLMWVTQTKRVRTTVGPYSAQSYVPSREISCASVRRHLSLIALFAEDCDWVNAPGSFSRVSGMGVFPFDQPPGALK